MISIELALVIGAVLVGVSLVGGFFLGIIVGFFLGIIVGAWDTLDE